MSLGLNFQLPSFDETDKARAVAIAERWLKNFEEKDKLKEDVFSLLESWKLECGETITFANFFSSAVSEDEKFELFCKRKPWECAPPWIESNPISLLIHIWAAGFRKIEFNLFLKYLAMLIIYSGNANKPEWIPAMVKNALWLAEIYNEALYNSGSKMFNPAKRAIKNTSALLSSKDEISEKRRIAELKKDIHAKATYFLQQGKNPRTIISLIHRDRVKQTEEANKELPEEDHMKAMTQRRIRMYLADHPSGNWAPKKKK